MRCSLGDNLHARRAQKLACATLGDAVDGHAALHADAHATKRGARLAKDRVPARFAGHHDRRGNTGTLSYEHVSAVDQDGNLPISQARFLLGSSSANTKRHERQLRETVSRLRTIWYTSDSSERKLSLLPKFHSKEFSPVPHSSSRFAIASLFIAFFLPQPALPALLAGAPAPNPVRALIERYNADSRTLAGVYTDPLSPATRARKARFDAENQKELEAIDFDALDEEGKADYLLMANHLIRDEHARTLASEEWKEEEHLLPFATAIFAFEDAKRRIERPNGGTVAEQLTAMTAAIVAEQKSLKAGVEKGTTQSSRITAWRAAGDADELRKQLAQWFKFYDGYDPTFTWWATQPYKQVDAAMKDYAVFLREKVAGIAPDDETTVIGTPVGRAALIADLQDEMIPYTPEELIAMAKVRMAWCKQQMIAASRQMGYGDDWRKALEKVKDSYVAPGEQPQLIRDLAVEGEEFAEKNNLVTIPPLAKETWRMEMMTPKRQLENPYFTGGRTISVSYPTDTMTFEQRMMSMQGNNPSFSRATVFHELIPGHWLQEFMSARYRPYRRPFSTGFWIEGNAFYWEMIYWNLGFDATPEERIGALFWRMHRCARIIFSLSFQLGEMMPEQAVDFLVDDGLERNNAIAEVRRSVDGSYDPLYQCGYMLGALQFMALRHELVDSGKMTDREYNDAILHENSMPVEMLRAILTDQKLTREYKTSWRFLEEVPPPSPAH
jgi:uncharacterized protein (DUF885 family)